MIRMKFEKETPDWWPREHAERKRIQQFCKVFELSLRDFLYRAQKVAESRDQYTNRSVSDEYSAPHLELGLVPNKDLGELQMRLMEVLDEFRKKTDREADIALGFLRNCLEMSLEAIPKFSDEYEENR